MPTVAGCILIMAYRKTHLRKFQPSSVLPIWTSANAELNTTIFLSCLREMGITNLVSYIRKLYIAVAICTLTGFCIGAAYGGIGGMVWGVLLGFATPAAVIWTVITAIHIAIHIGMFCAAAMAVFYVLKWILHFW